MSARTQLDAPPQSGGFKAPARKGVPKQPTPSIRKDRRTVLLYVGNRHKSVGERLLGPTMTQDTHAPGRKAQPCSSKTASRFLQSGSEPPARIHATSTTEGGFRRTTLRAKNAYLRRADWNAQYSNAVGSGRCEIGPLVQGCMHPPHGGAARSVHGRAR